MQIMPFRTTCWALMLQLAAIHQFAAAEMPEKTLTWAIVVHGGAGASPARASRAKNMARRTGIERALQRGATILREGGTALDAVEQTIRMLEDDPQFNAGKGAVLNADDGHELDASIMDGRDGNGGAVAGVKTIRNPISLARLVMSETRHVLLAAEGADRFGREMQVELVDQDYFHTEAAQKKLQRARNKAHQDDQDDRDDRGTVGCAALDSAGNLAAGTSTGGLTNKKFGRVGDSPILGAGTFADNKTCAVSATGVGELFMRGSLAYDVSAQMHYGGKTLPQALANVIHEKLDKGTGGMIGVDHNGQIAVEFNTDGMASGAADSSGRWDIYWDVDASRPE